MQKRLKFFISYALCWLLLFTAARFMFMAYNFPLTLEQKSAHIVLSFIHGSRLDISLAGYILMLAGLILTVSVFIPRKITFWIFNILTPILIAICTLIFTTDIELYRNWGFRIDTTIFQFLATPKEAFASIPTWQIFTFTLFWLLFTVATVIVFHRRALRQIKSFDKPAWFMAPLLMIIAAAMIIPIRGGFGLAPINSGSVYFSNSLFANHSALNAVWNFNYSLTKINKTKLDIHLLSRNEAQSIKDSLYKHTLPPKEILNTDNPNVVIILMESCTANILEVLGGESGITPNLNQLAKEGLLFSNIYSTADRSDKGLVGTLCGFPAHPSVSIMKFPQKTQAFDFIPKAFHDRGYSTAYYYGGDSDFANMNSLVINGGFERLVDDEQFPSEMQNSKWGVHDHLMLTHLLSEIDSAQAPFFKTLFTLSCHEPFDVPIKTVFKGHTAKQRFLNAAFYADKSIGDFFARAKTREWYKNTLFILLSDHGHPLPNRLSLEDKERYRIPVILLGGALKKKGVVIDKIGSQTDLAKTLVQQFDSTSHAFPYSKNLLAPDARDFAIFFFRNGFGYVSPKGSVSYNLESQKFIREHIKDESIRRDAKGLFQFIINDYNSR